MLRLRRAARLAVVPWVALVAAFSWGAAVHVALADHYHTTCAAHGFIHGESTVDGSFHSRVEPGCESNWRRCELYSAGNYVGASVSYGTSTSCNAWSKSFGTWVECPSYARVSAEKLSEHNHRAHNWCG